MKNFQEFDNDAETLVSSLAVNNDDDELESGTNNVFAYYKFLSLL
jgi:hypothetical protein